MSYANKDVTKDEINLWKKNKLINPRTNRKIKLDSKIYKYLQEMEKSMNKKKSNSVKTNKISKKENSNQKLTQTETILKDDSLSQTETVSKTDVNIQTELSNNEVDNLKNKLIEIENLNDTNEILINELSEKLQMKEDENVELKKSINNLENNNINLKKDLSEKNKLLEENNKKIEELKNQIEKDKLNHINFNKKNDPNPNNLMLVVPIAILCIGWVIKNSLFGF